MVFACLRTGFEKRFGVKNWFKMHQKTVCKTCLNLEPIFNAFGPHFGSIFRFRMGLPSQNFRFRSGSLLGLCFGSAQECPQDRFVEVLCRCMTCFLSIFQAQSLLVGAFSENCLVCPQYWNEETLGGATSFFFYRIWCPRGWSRNMVRRHHDTLFIFCSFRFRGRCHASWMSLGLHWGLMPPL